jgi:hypothetical protein
LRVEGVNLSAFVFDTRDLSTARGGSLMLLDAVEYAAEALRTTLGQDKVCILSQGASSGLFAIYSNDPHAAAGAVRERLAKRFPHATFVVDVAPISANFRDDVESLLAANRWRQMQATSLAIPPINTNSASPASVCGLDGVRPAAEGMNVREHQVSACVWQRRKHGRKEKQKFYARKSQSSGLPSFAEDFESIAKDTRLHSGKLAVFYADGNRFGAIQAKYCTSSDRQSAWDSFVRGKREAFLKALLEDQIKADPEAWQNAGTARFETLLWGGDEVMFVMPAALGWRFATFFFEKLGGLNLKNAGAELPDEPLTHSAALAFCQDHAPIDRIKRLLKDQMVEFAKATDRSRDSLVVVALESFDHLGTAYERAMNKRYNHVLDVKETVLFGRGEENLAAALGTIASGIDQLRKAESFARSQLRTLVSEMLEDPDHASERAKLTLKDDQWWLPGGFRNAEQDERTVLGERLLPRFESDVALWIQLEELWDYALP